MAGLKEFFDKEIAPSIDSLEKERKASRIRLIIFNLVVILLVSYYYSSSNALTNALNAFRFLRGAALPAFFALNYLAIKFLSRKYQRDFSAMVVDKIIPLIAPGFSYEKDKTIQQISLEISGLFSDDIEKFSGEDLLDGYIDDVHLKFSQVNFAKKFNARQNFKGLFLMMPYEMDDSLNFQIIPNQPEGKFNKFLSLIKLKSTKKEFTENQEFNSLYQVDTDCSIEEIKSVLNPEMADRLLAFSSTCGAPVLYSFTRSYLFIFIPSDNEILSGPVWNKVNFDTLHTWAKCIETVLSSVPLLVSKTKSIEEIKQKLLN